MSDHGPIEDLRLRQEIAEHMNIVRSYTHAVLTKTAIGTAVAFRLGDRLFLITVGHIFTGEFEVRLFAGEGPSIRGEVLNHHFHPGSFSTEVHLDIGFVEVKNVPSLTACQLEQLHIGEAAPRMPKGDSLMFIAGCPVSGYTPQGRPPQIGLAVIAGYLRGGDEAILEVEYAQEGHSISPDGGTFEAAPFPESPGGFSGGGVWVLLQTKQDEVFQPMKHVKMCGTQFQWSPSRRILKAMRPRFSVPFFFECYPELRSRYGHVLAALG